MIKWKIWKNNFCCTSEILDDMSLNVRFVLRRRINEITRLFANKIPMDLNSMWIWKKSNYVEVLGGLSIFK